MKILNEITKYLRRLFYALPFAMKDDTVKGSDNQNGNVIVAKKEESGNLGEDLLKGEVTQQVEELRYSTVKVEDHAQEYSYVGNGITEKKTVKHKPKYVSQSNNRQVKGIYEASTVEEMDSNSKFTVKIERENLFPRFRLEEFVYKVNVKTMKASATVEFVILEIPDRNNKKSGPFVNYIKKLSDDYAALVRRMKETGNITPTDKKHILKAFAEKYEVIDDIKEMSFTTYRASNSVSNYLTFTFKGKPRFKKITHRKGEYIISLVWKKYELDDLSEKFHSETMERKYKNKERKDVAPMLMINKKR